MNPEFITYQKFDDPALAEALAETLRENDIEYMIQEESSGFDPSMSMSRAAVDYAVKVRPEDFDRIREILLEQEEKDTADVDKDYYLFSFTDDELMDVVTKADEWSTFDVVLARKILAERGKTITDKDIAEIEEERIEELKKPEGSQSTWIIVGYLAALLGGVLGIFIGWFLANGKKTLPDGERVYLYSEHDRRHGRIIFYLSLVLFIAAVAIRLFVAVQV
jgi:hypothetical protein